MAERKETEPKIGGFHALEERSKELARQIKEHADEEARKANDVTERRGESERDSEVRK